MDNKALAEKLKQRYETLKGARSAWETLWTDIAAYVMPRRTPGLNGTIQSPSTQNESRLFDTTAVRANMTLANGQLAWMSPLEAPWFSFEPKPKQGDDVRQWLAKATEVARDELAISNFYTAVHEFYLDRGAFGTACLYVEQGRRNLLNTQCWPVGSFVIDEDESGLVDTVIREFKLTPRQAAQKFGEDKLSEKIRKALQEGGTKALEPATFLHAIYPREDADRDKLKMDGENMPIASVYLEVDGCHICKTGGYEEAPFMVSRYLEWGSGAGGLYGWSPAFAALPDARQVNFLEKMGDAMAEKAAFPPVLAPEELEGEIDGNAMGVTYFSQALKGSLPTEWMTQGRYDVLTDRVKRREESINSHFHVDLFQMFAQIEKQMTAREVAERSSEKLIQFSPTFSRLTSELFNPLLERIFGIGLRTSLFGPVSDIPESLMIRIDETRVNIPTPRVQFSSRIALALRSLPSLGYARALERIAMVQQFQPDVLDNFNFDVAERRSAISDGVPPDYLRTEEEVKTMRQARQEAAAAEQQQQQAALMAESAAKLGSVKSDTPVGKAIESQLQTA